MWPVSLSVGLPSSFCSHHVAPTTLMRSIVGSRALLISQCTLLECLLYSRDLAACFRALQVEGAEGDVESVGREERRALYSPTRPRAKKRVASQVRATRKGQSKEITCGSTLTGTSTEIRPRLNHRKYRRVPTRLPAETSGRSSLAGTAWRITSSTSMAAGVRTMPTRSAERPRAETMPSAPTVTSSPPTAITARPMTLRPTALG